MRIIFIKWILNIPGAGNFLITDALSIINLEQAVKKEHRRRWVTLD